MTPSRSATGVRRAIPLLLLALLLAPPAGAHLPDARPTLQPVQPLRLVEYIPRGMALDVELHVALDPLRQGIVHRLDPAGDGFRVEHREDPSDSAETFFAQWDIERIIEYRDNNLNGRWEPDADLPLKTWRPEEYRWRIGGLQRVQVADVEAESGTWIANLSGAPDIRIEAVAAGVDLTDEGALARPQDVVLYFDITNLPPRSVGSLHAVEARVRVDDETALALHQVEDTPTALAADAPRRRAVLVWGGQALVDDTERRLGAELRDETAGEDGNRSALLVLHLPQADEGIRFVIVWGVEYLIEVRRGTPLGPELALVALALGIAVAGRGRTHAREKT